MKTCVVTLFAVLSSGAFALTEDFPRVRGIAAEGVIVPASEAKRQAILFGDGCSFFTPSDDDIQQLEARLPRFLAAEAARDRDFREEIAEIKNRLLTYRRQYVGLIVDDRKEILLNAFPKDERLSWQRQFIEVSDGGTDFWRVIYEMRRQKFSRLIINGVAWNADPPNHAMQRTALSVAFLH
jgi:hypothetical protein